MSSSSLFDSTDKSDQLYCDMHWRVVMADYYEAPFAASLNLILEAPALFAASIYMFLGRIIRLVKAEHHAIIRIGWLTKIFVLGDVVSFGAQIPRAVILNQQTAVSYSRGSNIITIGLAV